MKRIFRLVIGVCAPLALFAAETAADTATNVLHLDTMVVTASQRAESVGQLAASVLVFDQTLLEQSRATSMTDFLAENATGFFSEWTPGQTSINLRGAASDGQGRDFRSQVVVLVNGRRAGTANLSKLSLEEIERIEIVRGPASVLYGSQAIGGVINLITKDGLSAAGGKATATAGSWDRYESTVSYGNKSGRFDYFAGLHAGYRADYESGEGSVESPMINTGYKRFGGLLALGYTFETQHRLQLDLRSDGVYDTGFRGSAWDYDNREDRFNQSAELTYTGFTPDKKVTWTAQYYYFRDTDDFRWGTEVVRSGTGTPAAGFAIDDNERILDAHGLKLFSQIELWENNNLLAGADMELNRVRSERFRSPATGNATTTQVPPFDNNADGRTAGIYLEDVQHFWDEKVSVRAGGRYDYGEQALKATPNLPTLLERTETFDSLTYSAGVAYRPWNFLKLRSSVGTGFRAPTASELASDFTAVQGGQIIGNPNLEPEKSLNYDAGVTFEQRGVWLDVVYFNNTIMDRITTTPITASRSQYVNRSESAIQGLESQIQFDLARWLNSDYTLSLFGGGAYNFEFKDKDPAAAALNTDNLQRMYEYQTSVGAVVGQPRKWDFRLTGVLRGPMWYDTEENLLIPAAEPNRNFIHRKAPFWVLNARARFHLKHGVTLWVGANNLFDVNEHPIFIALNQQPVKADSRFSNGGVGNSMPGREILGGVEWRF